MCQLAQFPSMMYDLTYSVLETRSMLADSVFKDSIPNIHGGIYRCEIKPQSSLSNRLPLLGVRRPDDARSMGGTRHRPLNGIGKSVL